MGNIRTRSHGMGIPIREACIFPFGSEAEHTITDVLLHATRSRPLSGGVWRQPSVLFPFSSILGRSIHTWLYDLAQSNVAIPSCSAAALSLW